MCSLSYGTVDIQGRVRGWMLSVGISPSQYHLHVCRRRVVMIEFAPRLALPRHRCSSADFIGRGAAVRDAAVAVQLPMLSSSGLSREGAAPAKPVTLKFFERFQNF